MITRRFIIIVALFSALLMTGCNQVRKDSDKPVFLNSKEIKDLFAGQTVEANNLNTRVTSFTYYSPNGKAVQERLWEKRQGNWSIEKNQICLQFENKSRKCRTIGIKDGRYYKYRADKKGKLETIVKYRKFYTGNTLKL